MDDTDADDALTDALDAGPRKERVKGRADEGADEGGDDGGRDGPVRRCLATGARRPQAAMIRFVLSPDGTVTPDLAARLPGRGMWLSADVGSIKTACARNLFAKAARARAVVPADLAETIERLLARRCVETLSLARRAGEAVTGFEKVRAALEKGEAAVLVEALDGADDGRRKLRQARARADRPSVEPVTCLTAGEIGEAFGRERAVHAALRAGGLARKLTREAGRLDGFRANGREDRAVARRPNDGGAGQGAGGQTDDEGR
ncbi:RNA-binding protein [Marivibrio halodurans]|uniref:RNA-binding protein n=1 Tax=Marivibrio halodurans TaxID=2039722 RepID=UPI0031BAFCF9